MLEGLVPAAKALEIILEDATPCPPETLPLSQCAGRVLATDLAALRTQPPFPASAMDGYAVRASGLASLPATLTIIGESAAGHPFTDTIAAGQAVRIFTGAPVPQGADAIAIQEDVKRVGDTATTDTAVEPGTYVRPAGLDFREGDICLKSGDALTPPKLALAASMGHAELAVVRKPLVALVATGDELHLPGSDLPEGGIIASNTFGLSAIIAAAGGEVFDLGIVRDRREALETAFRRALNEGADMIVTTGGASVGDHDLVRPAFEAVGGRMKFAKIAMRPGKPFLHGVVDQDGNKVPLLGLAGNPVSSIVAAMIFVRPLISRLAGRAEETIQPVRAVLASDLPANDEREEYMRATARRLENGSVEVTPFERQDSSMLALLARADALVIRPASAPATKKGDLVEAVLMADIQRTTR